MTIALTVAFALILIIAYAKQIQEVPATVGVTAVRKLHEAELEAVGQIVARGIDSAPQVLGVFENRDCGLYPAIEDEDIVDITDEVEMIIDDDETAKKAADEIAKESRGYEAIDDALRSIGKKLGADKEIEELEAEMRELRSRLIAARSNKRLAERLSN